MLLRCCIASSFYIKPQRLTTGVPASSVVLHPLSTSNHNRQGAELDGDIVVLHPLSTSNHNSSLGIAAKKLVVLHPLSTSNHNLLSSVSRRVSLYCILFLHQTTTRRELEQVVGRLYCILFLHQTTTSSCFRCSSRCCIASSFYIKPQPRTPDTLIFRHLTASRHDTKRGGVHRGSRFDAVFTFSTNIRKIIFTEIRRCMSVQRAGARLRSDSSEANI